MKVGLGSPETKLAGLLPLRRDVEAFPANAGIVPGRPEEEARTPPSFIHVSLEGRQWRATPAREIGSWSYGLACGLTTIQTILVFPFVAAAFHANGSIGSALSAKRRRRRQLSQ